MNILSIHETHYSPQILFNSEAGLIEIKGKSLPENANRFYEPLLAWIEEYIENPQPQTSVNFYFTYFNTSSSKYILEIFNKLTIIKKNGFDIEINWYYEIEEEDMFEAGQDFQEIVSIPFKMISYSNNKYNEN